MLQQGASLRYEVCAESELAHLRQDQDLRDKDERGVES